MPLVSIEALRLAIHNIAEYGDTDIFPYPVENLLFHDKQDEVCNVLRQVDANFDEVLASTPVLTAKELAAVGYGGFRQGTQIDPLWNAYLLALVIEAGSDIESRRLPPTHVFSYRFAPNHESGALFDKSIGWHEFKETIHQAAQSHAFVLRCDISDFYPRIYHHRLENALSSTVTKHQVAQRIMALVEVIADGPSYGLPVGGPAARLLSELLLNRVDRLLLNYRIQFCRFVDDYVIFASTREEAQSALITLTQFLITNEGLTLQKAKTRVMTASEFLSTSDMAEPDGESEADKAARTFRKLRIHYDPYSPTAEADYEALEAALSRFDIVGMLARELAKSRIDEGLTKRLVSAIRLLSTANKNDAVLSLVSSFDLLYPIFPSVMQLCKALLPLLTPEVSARVFDAIRGLISSSSYITQVPANLAFALRVLADDPSDEAEVLLAGVFRDTRSMMIRRDIILLMAKRRADHWISHLKGTFQTATGWERRALLIASYTLGDEGSHWRRPLKAHLDPFDLCVLNWVSENKSNKGESWRVPI